MIPILLLLSLMDLSHQVTRNEGLFMQETDPTVFTTVGLSTTDESFATFQTTLNLPKSVFSLSEQQSAKSRTRSNCENQFLCNLQRKSTFSKDSLAVPSKNLVPPFTDSEEEGLRTTETARTTLNDADADTTFPTVLYARVTPVRSIKPSFATGDLEKKPEASNELRSFLPAKKLAPAAAQVDLSYLPPKGVLSAAASLDITKVNYLPPVEETPAAAQTDARLAAPNRDQKDICSDAFHSFLCTPLKSRKRITGALPNSLIRSNYNPAASNTVQNTVNPTKTTPTVKPQQTQPPRPSKPPTPATPVSLPPSATTPAYAPQPSNVDRSYLPPVPKKFAASPSFNSISFVRARNEITTTTTRRSFSTSTPRPFIQTSIIPFISPKVIDELKLTPTTTTTTTIKPTTEVPVIRLAPEPSNEINKGYLPPATANSLHGQQSAALSTFQQRVPSVRVITETTTIPTQRFNPIASTANKKYLPPEPSIETSAAAQFNRALAPVVPGPTPQRQNHDHHDHHHHHHGRDLCTDPFHSFLCSPLKARKRITGALPPGFNPQSSNRKEIKIKPVSKTYPKPAPTASPDATLKPANSFQSETRIKPTEIVPAANALSLQTTGYQYPKPSPSFPLPSQSAVTIIKPTSNIPTSPRPTTSRPTTTRPTTGYQYPRPTNPLLLPSNRNEETLAEDRLSPAVTTFAGYSYPKPKVPFPLPSESQQQKLTTYPTPSSFTSTQKPFVTTPKVLQPQPSDQRSGYQYPKPSQSFPLPTGYQYPKPKNQLLLPTEVNSAPAPLSNSNPAALRDLGSAEFIPVNKIDAKRQAKTGGPRFGERIRARVRHQAITPAA